MNKLRKLNSSFKVKGKTINIAFSIVILIEILAIIMVSSFAWVETVSSLKIADNGKGRVDSFVYTDATIGLGDTIDLADYFKRAGDMHLAPASSADGVNFFFPKKSSANAYQTIYRKGSVNDKNTSYMSITFRVKTAENNNADFFFTEAPFFSSYASQIRVSVTAYSEGTTPTPDDTKIYGISSGTDKVVSGVGTASTAEKSSVPRKAFASSIKGTGHNNCLFTVDSDETKIVTINLWLQNSDTDMNSSMSSTVTIEKFGIISSLTPRKVSLVPGSEWSKDNPTYYAWCWDASNGAQDRLYKLTDNKDGSYGFEYPGNYRSMVFVRAKTGCAYETGADVKDDTEFWNNNVWNQTEDTVVPDSPVDPTYFITNIIGGTGGKSKGIWEEPGIVKLAYVTDPSTDYSSRGTLSAVYNDTINTQLDNDQWGGTYTGYTAAYQEDIKEVRILSFASDTTQASPTPSTEVTIKAAGKAGYGFEGWYTDPEGKTPAVSTDATATVIAPAKGTELIYYAKFKEVSTITLNRYVENSSGSGYVSTNTNTGTMYIGDDAHCSSGAVGSYSRDVAKGSQVDIYATAKEGYEVAGIFTTGSNYASDIRETVNGITYYTITASQSATYQVKYNLNSYKVTANATTGGTVKVGTGATGASSYAYVKYTKNVTLTATAASGYEFVGWYDSGTLKSTSASYTYNLNTPSEKTFEARFKRLVSTTVYVAPRENWGDNYYIRLYLNDGSNVVNSNNGFVQAVFDHNTGFYKATFTSSNTGTFYAILAKDNNHTGMVPSSGGYTGTLGKNYLFKYNQSGTSLTQYSSQRCIWFVIGNDVSWIKDNIRDYKDYMNIWYNANYRMRRINDGAYVWDRDTAPSGTFYFQQHYSGSGNRNEWAVSLPSGKSQYMATSYNGGYWLG